MAQFLALITTLDGGGLRPDNSLPQPPLGIWGGRPPNYVDIGGPGPQPTPTPPIYYPPPNPSPPYPSFGPGFPTNPIAPGGQPPYPSQGPGFPTHPIAPGGGWPPPHQPPGGPPGYWGGAPLPTPTPPIYFPPPEVKPPIHIPPDLPEEIPDLGPVDWKVGWTAQTGWVVVGVPNNPVVTPST
jgi:hypothetical protein